jgi:hypothetical protein
MTITGSWICNNGVSTEFYVHDGKVLSVIPVSEIVALGIHDDRALLGVEFPRVERPNGHDITAIRKEVGRLYGIVKDLEKDA